MYFYCIMSYSLSSLGSLRSFILGEYRLSRVPLESGCITHLTGFHENILRHSLGNFVGIAFYVNLLSIILSVVYTSRKSVFWFFIRPISFFPFRLPDSRDFPPGFSLFAWPYLAYLDRY